jgi:hypothetical protein
VVCACGKGACWLGGGAWARSAASSCAVLFEASGFGCVGVVACGGGGPANAANKFAGVVGKEAAASGAGSIYLILADQLDGSL